MKYCDNCNDCGGYTEKMCENIRILAGSICREAHDKLRVLSYIDETELETVCEPTVDSMVSLISQNMACVAHDVTLCNYKIDVEYMTSSGFIKRVTIFRLPKSTDFIEIIVTA